MIHFEALRSTSAVAYGKSSAATTVPREYVAGPSAETIGIVTAYISHIHFCPLRQLGGPSPEILEIQVPEGTGRLFVMQVHGGLPPYTTTAGAGTVRRGKDCVPLTGDLRDRLMVERGESDVTATVVSGTVESLLSAAALERLRDMAGQEQAPADLLRKTDVDLLGALDVLRDGSLTRAGLLLAGNADAIARHLPHYAWTHERMKSATAYVDRADGRDTRELSLPLALNAIEARIGADNPITTVERGLYHYEFRAYPTVALREALLNALCHLDLRLAGPVLVKQFPRKLEISNPGGLVGGITPANILHHPPLARNPLLVHALSKLRLVNRSNLGIGRMFEAMLIEGKEPPLIVDEESAVRVVFKRQETSAPFRQFIADEGKAGRALDVDHLLVLRYLLGHAEIDTATAAELCQRRDAEMRDILDEMMQIYDYLERGGVGRGTWWRLKPALHRRLEGAGHAERDRRIDIDVAKTRVLNMLKGRQQRGQAGLSNAEVRAVTGYTRQQVNKLIHELAAESVRMTGHGRGARYEYVNDERSAKSARKMKN